jgi:serine/threonine-protein kinase
MQMEFGDFETQLRLERNYGELIRLLQTRLAQFHFDSEIDRATDQVVLALTQHLAGDTAGAKVTAEQARNTLDRLYRDQPDSIPVMRTLSQAYAAMGEKDSALKAAERAVMLVRRDKGPLDVPSLEENVAVIQTIFGEDSRAISALTQLLQTPYDSPMYPFALTPALLRLDPVWDPLRADPAFQKLCEEKQP